MQYEVKTPEAYMAALAPDWRKEKLQYLRDLVKTKLPTIQEGINYKMLSYADEKGILFHLNAQKNYVSLYVGDAHKIDVDGTLLKGIDVGKGCIRFKKTTNIENTGLEEFIEKAIKMWQKGEDIDC